MCSNKLIATAVAWLFFLATCISAQVPITGGGLGTPATTGGSSIAFVGAADGGNATATSLTFSYTTGSGVNRLLVVGIIGDPLAANDTITGVTYNGVAMTFGAKILSGGVGNPGERNTYLYYLLNPASGANNVVVSSSSSIFIGALAADYTGVKQSAQPDATATQQTVGTTLTLTTAITTVADKAWAVLIENGYTTNSPPIAGAGDARRTFDAAFGAIGLFDSGANITPAGSYSMTTTRASGTTFITHVVVAFAPQ